MSRAKLFQNSGFGSSSDPATEHYCAFLQRITQLLLFIVYPFMGFFCFLFLQKHKFRFRFIVTFGIIQNPFSPKDPTLEAKKLRRPFIFVLFFILICPPPLSTVPPSHWHLSQAFMKRLLTRLLWQNRAVFSLLVSVPNALLSAVLWLTPAFRFLRYLISAPDLNSGFSRWLGL